MRDFCIKQRVSNDKGITLVALIITVVIMLIIVGISVNTGTESLDATRLKGFYSELEVIQKRVDDIATTNESYIDANGNTVYLMKTGTAYTSLTTAQKNIISNEIQGLNLTASEFRYFTKAQLESILGLPEIRYNVFIHFNSRTIIAEEGIDINGQIYRILKSGIYFVEQDTTNSEETVTSLTYSVKIYGSNNYKITVIPENSNGISKTSGTLKYKKSTSKYYETASNLEIVIRELTQYDILYEDNNKNILYEKIGVSLQSGIPKITVYNQS